MVEELHIASPAAIAVCFKYEKQDIAATEQISIEDQNLGGNLGKRQ